MSLRSERGCNCSSSQGLRFDHDSEWTKSSNEDKTMELSESWKILPGTCSNEQGIARGWF